MVVGTPQLEPAQPTDGQRARCRTTAESNLSLKLLAESAPTRQGTKGRKDGWWQTHLRNLITYRREPWPVQLYWRSGISLD